MSLVAVGQRGEQLIPSAVNAVNIVIINNGNKDIPVRIMIIGIIIIIITLC